MKKPEKNRLRRTMMFMSAQKPALVKDAYIFGADSVILDLEDADQRAPHSEKRCRLVVHGH